MATSSSLENNNIKIPMPFGKNATYGGKGVTLPDNNTAQSTSNKASWNTGFPDSTFVPNNAPNGGDFNTLNNILSGLLMNTQLGQMINNYDSAFQASQGGYPIGAIIWYNTTSGNFSTRVLVQSLVENNTYVPYANSVINSSYWKQLLPQVVINNAPDYANKTDLGGITVPATGYTFANSGWLFLNYNGGYNRYWGINGNEPLLSAYARGTDYNSINSLSCMVSAGDTIAYYNSSGVAVSTTFPIYSFQSGAGAYFIPFKS